MGFKGTGCCVLLHLCVPLVCVQVADGPALEGDAYQMVEAGEPAVPAGAASEPPATPVRSNASLPPAQQTPSPTTPASTASSNPEPVTPQQAVESITRAAAKKRLARLFAPRVDGTYAVDPQVAKLWCDTKQQNGLIDEFIALGYCKVLRV